MVMQWENKWPLTDHLYRITMVTKHCTYGKLFWFSIVFTRWTFWGTISSKIGAFLRIRPLGPVEPKIDLFVHNYGGGGYETVHHRLDKSILFFWIVITTWEDNIGLYKTIDFAVVPFHGVCARTCIREWHGRFSFMGIQVQVKLRYQQSWFYLKIQLHYSLIENMKQVIDWSELGILRPNQQLVMIILVTISTHFIYVQLFLVAWYRNESSYKKSETKGIPINYTSFLKIKHVFLLSMLSEIGPRKERRAMLSFTIIW